jgi:hypothetical protein
VQWGAIGTDSKPKIPETHLKILDSQSAFQSVIVIASTIHSAIARSGQINTPDQHNRANHDPPNHLPISHMIGHNRPQR